MNQKTIVYNHIKEKGSITSKEAISLYNITRLAAIVGFLREDGIEIKTELEGPRSLARYSFGVSDPVQIKLTFREEVLELDE